MFKSHIVPTVNYPGIFLRNASGYYNPNVLSSLFQTGQGSTLVTAVGDPVGLELDIRRTISASDYVGVVDGSSGDYFSTPDSAAASVTGDIEIEAYVLLEDWTPTLRNAIVGKRTATGNHRSYSLEVTPTGNLEFEVSANGATTTTYTSSVAPTVSDGQALYVKVQLDLNDGASASRCKFYTSSDGVTYSQLGTDVTAAVVASIYDGTAPVTVGAIDVGASWLLNGRAYWVKIKNGIDGTTVVHFDPTQYSGSGATFTAETGEVWTKNGTGCRIVPSWSNYLVQKTSGSRPVLGIEPKGGVRNLLTYSEQFDNAAWTKNTGGSISATNSTTAPDGTVTADTWLQTATPASAYCAQIINVAASTTHTHTLYVKKIVGTWIRFAAADASQTDGFGAWFNLDTASVGTTGTFGSGATFTSADITSANNDFYRISITGIVGTDTTIFGCSLFVAANDNSGTRLANGSCYVWGGQTELGSTATTYQRKGAWYDCTEGTGITPANSSQNGHFPSIASDGTDDYYTSSSGGGGTTGILLIAALRVRASGAARTLWSDTGTNTGYKLTIDASNQPVLSAGNGSSFTSVTGPAMTAGGNYVICAWHDGVNLNISVNNGAVTSQAFATATAGTTGFTVGRDNGASSSYSTSAISSLLYFKDEYGSAAERNSAVKYFAQQAGISL